MNATAPESHRRTTAPRPRTLHATRATIAAGAIAGSTGAGLMLLVLVVRAIAAGNAPFGVLAMFGGALVHGGSPSAHAVATWLGLFVHVAVSLFFGIAFAFVVARRPPRLLLGRLAAGIAAAFLALVIMTFAVVPVVAPALYQGVARDWSAWVLAHVAYGIGLADAPLARHVILSTRSP
jgi:hypothetical protein